MPAPWVIEEMKTADLEDERLNRRLDEVISQFAGHPTASIPAACGGYAEMTAAYRLFDNQKVNFQNVIQPHIDATRRRIAEQAIVILPQDTTEIDLTRPQQQVGGAGPLDGGARYGFFLHPLHAFTPDGTPLGTLYATTWARGEEAEERTPAEKLLARKHTPIEEKESYRWVETMRVARQEAALSPQTRLVCVADSEADIYELLVEAQEEPRQVDWIVRSCQDRALQLEFSPESAEFGAVDHLHDMLMTQAVWFEQVIKVRGHEPKVACEKRGRRQPRESRTATVQVRACQLTLRGPRRHDRKLPDVKVNVVLARELDPPAGEVAVEWMLLTSLPIDDIEQVRRVIQYYCVRWQIEIFFRVLKSGCRVEARRFEQLDRFLPCLAVYLIVTWRTLFVCRLGREFPDLDCEAVFDPAEWKAVYRVVRNQAPPTQPPTLSEMVKMIAQLGGYVNRNRPDAPGPQTVWLGLQRMHDMAICWELFGPGTQTEEAKDV